MKFVMIAVLALASLTSFADVAQKATKAQVKQFCKVIDQELERNESDFATDIKKCERRKNFMIISELVASPTGLKTVIEIVGSVPFNSPNRSYDLSCKGIFEGRNKIVYDSCR